MFSSFLMTLFLLPTERHNKIRVRKGKFFDECVGSVLADVSVVCRWCVDLRVGWCVYRCIGGIGFFTFTYNSSSSSNGSSVASSSTHTAFTPFFLQARAICPLVLQLWHVAFLNLHFDCTWPAFPQAYEFDWGGESEFGWIPWCKRGGTREFPPEDRKTAEFLETESTDKVDDFFSNFFFSSHYYWLISYFAQAFVPTNLLYLNIT